VNPAWPPENLMSDEPTDDPATILRELQMIIMRGSPGSADDIGSGEASLRAAARAYEDARIDGLCHEGAWELALRMLNAGV